MSRELRSPAGGGNDLPGIAIVAASLDILGGQEIQAEAVSAGLREEGVRVVFIPINPRFPPGFRWLRRCPGLRTALNQALYLPRLAGLRRADVAHVFSASCWSFLLAPVPAMLAARLFGKRVVLHYHSGNGGDHLARWGSLVHPWLRLADTIVVPSDSLKAVFERHGYRPRVIRNVVDTARFRYRDRSPLRPRLLSARNLEPHYRVDVTLRAFALLRARYPDASLTIAGAGSQDGRLRRLAGALGARGIRFLGRVDRESMPAVYGAADLFVNSSVVDEQPVSVLEAFAAGLPVVSTGTGDIAAMARHETRGLIVPADDPAALAAGVTRLLEDPGLALRLARSARGVVEEYSWSRVRGAWAETYRGRAA